MRRVQARVEDRSCELYLYHIVVLRRRRILSTFGELVDSSSHEYHRRLHKRC